MLENHWETRGWRCPLVTGDADALTGERRILWEANEFHCVFEGVDVWRLDPEMATHGICTVPQESRKSIGETYFSALRGPAKARGRKTQTCKLLGNH